jgi:hypothetical protein
MSRPVEVARGFRSPALRTLFLRAVAQGWRWRVGGDHVVLYPPDAATNPRPLILSTTAHDGRARATVEAQFRKAGLR